MRSKTWQSGRNESAVSCGPMPLNDRQRLPSTLDTRLACVSITPLGSPVVPEV